MKELHDDYSKMVQEWQVLRDQATTLGRFEYDNLDEDLGTKQLEQKLANGEVITDEEDPTVREAYGRLLDKYSLADRKFREFETIYATETSGSENIKRFFEAGELLWEEFHPQVQARPPMHRCSKCQVTRCWKDLRGDSLRMEILQTSRRAVSHKAGTASQSTDLM